MMSPLWQTIYGVACFCLGVYVGWIARDDRAEREKQEQRDRGFKQFHDMIDDDGEL